MMTANPKDADHPQRRVHPTHTGAHHLFSAHKAHKQIHAATAAPNPEQTRAPGVQRDQNRKREADGEKKWLAAAGASPKVAKCLVA
jgi:hypothetical protein